MKLGALNRDLNNSDQAESQSTGRTAGRTTYLCARHGCGRRPVSVFEGGFMIDPGTARSKVKRTNR